MDKEKVDLDALRLEYQKLGYFQKFEGRSFSKEWITKKHLRILQSKWSTTGWWESLQASGTLKINYFVFQKMLWLSDGEMYTGHELVLGPLHIMYVKK